jgi:hypothetical protein
MGAITLQFVTSRDPESWAIRTFQRGWCSHVDSVMDDGRLLGARSDGGVQIRPPNYEKFSRVERVVISATTRNAPIGISLRRKLASHTTSSQSLRLRSIATGARRMRGLRRADSGWARTG